MKTHTPGPFPLKVTNVDDFFVIITNQGNHYAKTFDPAAAHLIASAPDLLASLIELESMVAEMLPKYGPCGWGELALSQAREAIAKAKGNE